MAVYAPPACAATARALAVVLSVDRAGAIMLLPYAAWTGFATALTASIVRRNPGR